MIGSVDEALRALVREAVDSTSVEVVLDAPTKDWAARRNAPTVDMYLYDLREDMRRRSRGFLENRVEGEVRARFQPPRHFRLSYLVTAWTQRPEDEHRLLDAVLVHLLRFDALPARVLEERLVAAERRPHVREPAVLGRRRAQAVDRRRRRCARPHARARRRRRARA